MGSFNLKMHQNPFSAEADPTPLETYNAPRSQSAGEGHQHIPSQSETQVPLPPHWEGYSLPRCQGHGLDISK